MRYLLVFVLMSVHTAAFAQSETASPLQRAATATRKASDDAACATRCQRPLDMLAANRANQQAAAALLSGGTPTAQAATPEQGEYRACVARCMEGK